MRMKKAVAGIAMVVSMALSFGGCSDSEKDSESEVKTVEKTDNEVTNNKNDRDDREEVKDTGEDKASDDKTQKDEPSKDETSKGDESSDSTDDSSKENQKEDKDANTKEQENKTTKKNNTDSENKASTSKDSKPSESKDNEASDDSEDEQSAGDVTTNSDTQIKNEASKDTTSKVETQKETTAGQTTTQSQKETTAGQTTTQAQKETTASQTTTPPQTEPQTTPPASDTGVTLHEDVSRGLSEAIHQSAKNIVAGIIKGGMTEYDKVKAIHDYLVKNTYYPFNFSTADSYLFSAEGPLGDKKLAVCQGYTEAFSLLCYYAGIQTDIVYGTANNGTRTESHAWNTVRIDNEWYNVDVTWDDPLEETNTYGGNLCYAYFLVTDEFISKNHFAEDYTNKHSCTSTKFKETVKKLSAQAYIASYYGDINYYYANTDDEIRAVISAHSTGETFLIVYDLGHLYTEADYESCSTIFSNIGGLVSKVYSGAVQLNCSMITSTEYLYVAITLK